MTAWAVGLTTVPQRLKDHLPRTLASVHAAGFDTPRVFVDGVASGRSVQEDLALRSPLWVSIQVTARWPQICAWGNWVLGLQELLIRNPQAERFAMFQDDVVCVKGLRQYVERFNPPRGYLNLYTHPLNHADAPGAAVAGRAREGRWIESTELQSGQVYGGKMQQTGLGALALVFNRDAVIELLSSKVVAKKSLDHHAGHRSIDGCVCEAMNQVGWREWIHMPSLVQHTGHTSTMTDAKKLLRREAPSFPGENFSALDFVVR